MKIRFAEKADHDLVFEILNDEIRRDVNTWHLDAIEGNRRQAWLDVHSVREYPLLVADGGEGIFGWASLSPWAPHGAYLHTAEVSVFIHRSHRNLGVGKSLLHRLIVEARAVNHHVLISRIEISNEPSRILHLGSGFRSVGVMHEVGFKFARFLDAEIFELLL